ncbi:hypothetical protein V490_07578 [Pseudogymnoascus sp. VKM F-3557]|nr:hypothetical protein V490_07578 [Pseudogymnoascus sp. VKM F-3557]
MSSLLKKKGAASFKPRAPARRPGVTAPPSASPSIPPVEKQAQAPAPPSHNVPIPSVEVESPAALEVQSTPPIEKPAAPRKVSAAIPRKDSAASASSARQDAAVLPPPTKDAVQLPPSTTPTVQETAVPVPSSTRRRLSHVPTPPQSQETVPISKPTSRTPSIPSTTTAEPAPVTATHEEGRLEKETERSAASAPKDTAPILPPVPRPAQQHIDREDIERNDTATISTQDDSMDLSAMGAGETSHPSQLIPVVPLNPDGTSSIPTPVLPPKAKPKARKRKLDDANIDIRPSIEVQVNATKAPRTAAPRKPRKPREPRAATSSTPKPRAPRKKRAETPEDAEDQEIDHSTIKMADLCKDLKIGKKFSKHDEIKQRDIDRKAKAKLRRENPELVGASDDERPTATTRSETETPLQTTSVGPRMRLVDGQIVIDESSLNLDRHKLAAANAGVMEIIEENEFTRITTSGTFMKREKNIFWDLEAEEKFYVGLRMFGTDFEMISKMFPDRNRRQIKLKFNKEERLYPSKINSALLGEKVPINFDEYKSHTGLEYEDVAVINAEREEIEAEQNAEEARVEAELAEATRQKKAAIHATRGPEGKENNTFGGGSNSAKAKNKGKKKNKASAFGGGEDVDVGDIIAVTNLANKIRQRFVNSPEQFKAIATEVRSLSIVLQDADVFLPENELTSQQKTDLDGIVQGCRDLLEELQIALDKYQELDSGAKASSGRPRKMWKKLTWDQKEIEGFRGRISSNIMLLNTFLDRISSQAIFAVKDGVDRLNLGLDQLNLGQQEQQLNEEHQAIVDWLSPTNYATQHSDFASRRQEGTGKWLLDSDEFKKWLDESNQVLFCPGMPGAGKTMIASIVVDHLYAKYQTDPSVGIAYLYCNFRRHDEQKPVDLFASLLNRLLQGRSTLPNSIKALHKSHKKKQTRPSFVEISKELQSVIASFSTAFIVIDALDECRVSDGGQAKFLSEILRLQTVTKANLFVTSRFIPHIVEEFQGAVSLEIRASDGDVQRYLDEQLPRLPPFVRRNLDIQEQIKAEIVKAVDGMFLLAQLYLESLIGKKSAKAIKSALEKLPTGSEAYDYAYREAMERIEGQVVDSQELSKQALAWITCSKRPLTILELQHALAVEIGQSSLDEDNLPEIGDVVSVCAGLVTIDEESGIIRLVHYTTQEYFERTWTSWFPSAQDDITKTCVTYLLFSAFEGGFCATNDEFKERLELNPLYDYAAQNWANYACASSAEAEELIIDFLQNDATVSASSQAIKVSNGHYGVGVGGIGWTYSQSLPRDMRGTHLAAYFGLEKAIIALLRKGHNPDSKDDTGRTPLSWAALCGHMGVVGILLATPGVDINSKNIEDNTPLSLAVRNRHKDIMQLLLATPGVDVNSQNIMGGTPLSFAISSTWVEAVKLILATPGIDVHSMDTANNTLLSLAVWKGNEEIVQMLLATPAIDVNYENIDGETPLSIAISREQEELVKLLELSGAKTGEKKRASSPKGASSA